MKLPTILSGVAGEYFVAAELSRRGHIASITLRNTRGVDILAANAAASKSISIQVKTNQGSVRSWVLNEKVETCTAEDFFFVFVNLNGESDQPTFHIVPSEIVATHCRTNHAEWLAGVGRGGRPRKDNPVRKFSDEQGEYVDAWDLLGL